MFKLIRVLFKTSNGYGDEKAKKNLVEKLINDYPHAQIQLVLQTNDELLKKVNLLFSDLLSFDRLSIISLKDIGNNPEKYELADFCFEIALGYIDKITVNWADLTRSKGFAFLSPFENSEDSSRMRAIFNLPGQTKLDVDQLDPNQSSFFQHSTLHDEREALLFLEHTSKVESDKKRKLLEFIKLTENSSVQFQSVYGLRYILGSVDEIVNNQVRALAKYRKENNVEKPIFILLLNEFQKDAILKIKNKIPKKAVFIDFCDPSDSQTISSDLENKIFVLNVGSLPSELFDYLMVESDYPPFLEGANAEVLMQTVGKPYVKIEKNIPKHFVIEQPLELLSPQDLEKQITLAGMNLIPKNSSLKSADFLSYFYQVSMDLQSHYSSHLKLNLSMKNSKADRVDFTLSLLFEKIKNYKQISIVDYKKLTESLKGNDLRGFGQLIKGANPFLSPDSSTMSIVAIALTNKNYAIVNLAIDEYPDEDTLLPSKFFSEYKGVFNPIQNPPIPDFPSFLTSAGSLSKISKVLADQNSKNALLAWGYEALIETLRPRETKRLLSPCQEKVYVKAGQLIDYLECKGEGLHSVFVQPSKTLTVETEPTQLVCAIEKESMNCENEQSSIHYTSDFNSQLMLAQVALHLGQKAFVWIYDSLWGMPKQSQKVDVEVIERLDARLEEIEALLEKADFNDERKESYQEDLSDFRRDLRVLKKQIGSIDELNDEIRCFEIDCQNIEEEILSDYQKAKIEGKSPNLYSYPKNSVLFSVQSMCPSGLIGDNQKRFLL